MCSRLRQRARIGTMLCWQLVICLVAIAAATPLLAGPTAAVHPTARHHAQPADGPALPFAPAGSTAALDDLSGPAATATFRLSLPAVRYQAAPGAHTPRLQTRTHARAVERGPPARVR